MRESVMLGKSCIDATVLCIDNMERKRQKDGDNILQKLWPKKNQQNMKVLRCQDLAKNRPYEWGKSSAKIKKKL